MRQPAGAAVAVVSIAALTAVAGTLIACRGREPGPAAVRSLAADNSGGDSATRGGGGPTRVALRNVLFRVLPTAAMHVERLDGRLKPTQPGQPANFDDKGSFTIEVDSARIWVETGTLAALMNDYVLAYPGAPLGDIRVSTEGGELRQTGTLKKKVAVHFEMRGRPQVTADGKLVLHPTSLKTAEVPVKGLMNLFDIEMDEVIKVDPGRGLSLKGNDMILDPGAMVPDPKMHGRLTGFEIGDGRVEMIFGKPPATPHVPRGFMDFQGGTLRFGKLTMRDADLRMIDADPKDPFHFFMDRYNDQLVAGYSKNTPDHGLRVFVPDLEDVK